MNSLMGKVALVTGAGQGVGRGIAATLAREGAAIGVLGRTRGKLEDTCGEIAAFGQARAVVCDVGDAGQVHKAVSEVVEEFGGLDIVVNNAWSGVTAPLLSITEEQLFESFNTGPFATFRVMKEAYPHLKRRGGGSIINLVSSAMVRWDARFYGPYAAAKHAVRSLTRTAACEWGADGIRVNAISPLALSPALRNWIDTSPEESAAFLSTIPLGRIGDCEQDIGRAVLSLVSDQTSYLTGATIPLDGGQAYYS